MAPREFHRNISPATAVLKYRMPLFSQDRSQSRGLTRQLIEYGKLIHCWLWLRMLEKKWEQAETTA